MRLVLLFFNLIILTTVNGFDETAKNNSSKNSRQKRSVILLPPNTSITITFDLSLPVAALAQQLGFYNMRLPFRFFIPTYNQLSSYYGRADSREDEDNEIEQHYYRQEQERANEERRFIYKNIESFLSRYYANNPIEGSKILCISLGSLSLHFFSVLV